MRRVLFRGLILLAAGAAGCDSDPPLSPDTTDDRLGVWAPGPANTILRATQSGLESPRRVMVEDGNTWRALWTEAWEGTPNPPPLPFIDFVLASVVVVAAGQRGANYVVSVDSIVVYIRGGVAYATESQPGAGCPVGIGTSSPVHMVHMPGHPPIMEWRVSGSVRICP